MPLSDQTVPKYQDAVFECQTSRAGVPVTWLRNGEVIIPSDKFKITSEGATHQLVVQECGDDEAADYTVRCGDAESSANLQLEGTSLLTTLASRHQHIIPFFNPCY